MPRGIYDRSKHGALKRKPVGRAKRAHPFDVGDTELQPVLSPIQQVIIQLEDDIAGKAQDLKDLEKTVATLKSIEKGNPKK